MRERPRQQSCLRDRSLKYHRRGPTALENTKKQPDPSKNRATKMSRSGRNNDPWRRSRWMLWILSRIYVRSPRMFSTFFMRSPADAVRMPQDEDEGEKEEVSRFWRKNFFLAWLRNKWRRDYSQNCFLMSHPTAREEALAGVRRR